MSTELTSEQISTLMSMNLYWSEIVLRENSEAACQAELQYAQKVFGSVNILKILSDYVTNEISNGK